MTDHLDDALSALLDSQLEPADTTAAHHHLEGCPRCRSELDAVSQARDWLRTLPPVEPPGLFFENLLTGRPPGVEGMPAARRRRPLAVLVGGAAASVALVSLSSGPRTPAGSPITSPPQSAAVSADPIVNLAPAGIPVSFRR